MNFNYKDIFKIIVLLFAFVGIVFTFVFIAMQFGLLNVKGSAAERNSYFDLNKKGQGKNANTFSGEQSAWANSDEWKLMREVFTRDQAIIKKAGIDAGISPRLIISGVMGEQLRFLTSNRETFKRYFEPMKILGSMSQFSYGIAGIKLDTAKLIEDHLKDSSSPFYLGKSMEHTLDYGNGTSTDEGRMDRITDVKDPYYSYLYVGLSMKQVMTQWKNAGFNIDNRPEIVSTLYNLGFNRSIPKADALAGGAVIDINGTSYTFGDLGYEFYYSSELADIFPR